MKGPITLEQLADQLEQDLGLEAAYRQAAVSRCLSVPSRLGDHCQLELILRVRLEERRNAARAAAAVFAGEDELPPQPLRRRA